MPKQNIVKKFCSRWRYYLVLFLAIASFILLGTYLHKTNFFTSKEQLINFYGFSITVIAILVAIIQTIRNHDWNRRHSAMTFLLEILEKIKPSTDIIHNHFGYFGLGENQVIKVDEIHKKICEEDDRGKFEQDQTTKMYSLKKDREVFDAIREVLNLYEHIAAGVYQGVYDKDVVTDLMASNFIKMSNVFSEYITHVNEDMYPQRNGKIWINLKTFGSELREKHRKNPKAKERARA